MKKHSEHILAEIDQHLTSLTELYKSCRGNNRQISLLDIDLMKQMLRNLYQEINNLGSTHGNTTEGQAIPQQNMESYPAVAISSESKMKTASLAEHHSPVVTKYPEANTAIPSDNSIIFAELLIETESTSSYSEQSTIIEHSQKEIKTSVEKEMKHTAESVKETIVSEVQSKSERKINLAPVTLFDEPIPSVKDKFKESESVYKQIAKTHKDESLVGQLQKKPVADLRKSIGINERFAFINDLFHGNQQLFSESIDKINNCASYSDADKLFKETGESLKWNTGSKLVDELSELIKRRFSV